MLNAEHCKNILKKDYAPHFERMLHRSIFVEEHFLIFRLFLDRVRAFKIPRDSESCIASLKERTNSENI